MDSPFDKSRTNLGRQRKECAINGQGSIPPLIKHPNFELHLKFGQATKCEGLKKACESLVAALVMRLNCAVHADDFAAEDDALDAALDFEAGEGRPLGLGKGRGVGQRPLFLQIDLDVRVALVGQVEDALRIVVALVHHVLSAQVPPPNVLISSKQA